jgi:hypothetical protein
MNGKVEDYWVPRVKDALAKRRASVK